MSPSLRAPKLPQIVFALILTNALPRRVFLSIFALTLTNDLLDTVHIMLDIEPQIEKIVLQFCTRQYNK